MVKNQGDTGLQGVTGATGTRGATGVQGQQGIQGLQGVTGAQGQQGLQGITGVKGATGSQGIQGLQGVTGAQGIQGIQGIQGEQGIQGITGSTGATGAAGVDARPTFQGQWSSSKIYLEADIVKHNDFFWHLHCTSGGICQQGEPGTAAGFHWLRLKGDTGETGSKGATGARGEKGDKGATGARGEQGTQGIQGVTGSEGLQGATGATGAKGVDARQIYRGQWSVGITYEDADIVKHVDKFWQLHCSTSGVCQQGEPSSTAGYQWISLVGATGMRGATGAVGEKGDKGNTGEKGSTGATGAGGRSVFRGIFDLNVDYHNGDLIIYNQELYYMNCPSVYVVYPICKDYRQQKSQLGLKQKAKKGNWYSWCEGCNWRNRCNRGWCNRGDPGARGATGATGADARQLFRGQWSVASTYKEGDIVKHLNKFWQLHCSASGICQQGEPSSSAGFQWISLVGATGSQGIQGIQGVTGAQGIQGIQGITGATGVAGRSIFRGVFDLNIDYHNGDLVLYHQKLYYMTCPSVYDICPSNIQGLPTSDESGWVAAKGDKGETGEKGDKGDTGERGATGAQGIQGIQGERGVTGSTGADARSIYRGQWTVATTYEEGDIVKHLDKFWQLQCSASGTCFQGEPSRLQAFSG